MMRINMKLAILAIVLLSFSRGIYANDKDDTEDQLPCPLRWDAEELSSDADNGEESDDVDSLDILKDTEEVQENEEIEERSQSESLYIVIFKEEATAKEVESHKESLKTMSGVGPIRYEYDFGNEFRGYAAPMPEEKVAEIENHPAVKYVEKDKDMYTDQFSCTYIQRNAIWGLVRSCRRSPNYVPPNNNYILSGLGSGVNVYVLDTGIYTLNTQFQGRARWGYSFDGKFIDDTGHGTHVAGTIMSITYGVAKRATAIAVRVCYRNSAGKGVCPNSAIYAGLNYVYNQHRPGAKSVINMSLGGPANPTMDSLLRRNIATGVHASVSAGNDGINACLVSPARVSEANTVGGIDITNRQYYNYGSCVDILAPGVRILSTLPYNRIGYMSGTSMAAPHVAGGIANILEKKNWSPATMQSALKLVATTGQVVGLKPGTPNRILFIPCY